MSADRGLRRAVIVLLAAIVGAAATARLGWWQLDRAAQKEALQQSIDAAAALPELPPAALATSAPAAREQHYRAVRLRGTWLAHATVFLDNRQMDGKPGFFVVTPLRLSGSNDAVLLQRGWLPRDVRDRKALPHVATPSGEIELHGRIAPPPSRLYQLGADEQGPIRQNLDVEDYAREIGVRLRPLSVQQDDDSATSADHLLRHWPRPAVDVAKHHGYAFQWFALSALITGLYVWFQLLSPRLHRKQR
jgi:surfeit locus 1 family protein